MTDKITEKQAKLAAEILGVIVNHKDGLAFNDSYNYEEGIPLEEWRFGIQVETEHGQGDLCTDVTHGDLLTTARISLTHFKEYPNYYQELKKIEEGMESRWKKWKDSGNRMPKIVEKQDCTIADRWEQYISYRKKLMPVSSYYIWSLGGKPKINSSHPQSILFRKRGWSENKARKWLKKHGYKSGKVDKTKNYLRFRQESPSKFKEFRIQSFGTKGIKVILGWKKPLPKRIQRKN